MTNEEIKMKELIDRYGGYGERTATTGEKYRTFATPEGGMIKTSETGDFISETMPSHYSNKYSPYDQQQLEKLYKARSEAAQDPELTPDERQAAFDKIDSRISAVPRLSPIMKEPTPQEKFNASVVTLPDGTKGLYDAKNNKFNAFEPDAAKQKQQEEYDKLVDWNLKQMMSDESLDGLPYDVKVARAHKFADIRFGFDKTKGVGVVPKLDALWTKQMNAIDYGGLFRRKGNKLTYKDLKDVREKYVVEAMKTYKMTSEEALFDFMNRMQQSQDNPDDPYHKILPKLTPEQDKEYKRAMNDYLSANDPYLNNVPDERLLPDSMKEKTSSTTKTGNITVISPDGQLGIIPAEDLDDALNEGYTIAK